MFRPRMNVESGLHCGLQIMGAASESKIRSFVAPTQGIWVYVIKFKKMTRSTPNLTLWINMLALIS